MLSITGEEILVKVDYLNGFHTKFKLHTILALILKEACFSLLSASPLLHSHTRYILLSFS